MKKGNKQKKKALFIFGVALSPFKQRDLEILKRHFEVRVLKGGGLSLFGIPGLLRILRGVLWADFTFSWFAGEYALWAALFSKVFRKKSIVVAGGGEVAKVPEIGYGGMLNPKAARRVKRVLKYSDKVLAVSQFNAGEILKYANRQKVETIYNAVDHDRFNPVGKKEELVITVSTISQIYVKRKGLTTFIEAARYLPSITFILVGEPVDRSFEDLRSIAGPNVEFTGFIPDEGLAKYYQRAKVYCQISLHEAFGVALAEAMLCECVPVVTSDAALPEVVGDTGFYVPYEDAEATAEAIKRALNSDKGKEARERIKNLFPIERRERELLKVISTLVPRKGICEESDFTAYYREP